MHSKRIISLTVLFLVLAVAGTGLYFWYPNLKDTVSVFVKATQDIVENKDSVLNNLKQELFTDPIRASKDYDNAKLSSVSIIDLTNRERVAVGLAPVTENTVLDSAARAKLQDMFDQQYFEHISPDGHGPGYVVNQAGYSYIIVGENLALGNFETDQALVDAWMASPGHKANILHERFNEIGVAVGQGMYKGKRVWMAVQEFGLGANACPEVQSPLKDRIDTSKQAIGDMETKLELMRMQISQMPRKTAEQDALYEQKAKEYNAEVEIYNIAIAKLKKDVDAYNASVRAFNACIKG